MRRSAGSEPIRLMPPSTFDERIRRNMYRILYHVLRGDILGNTLRQMSYQEFVATIERMIAQEDEA